MMAAYKIRIFANACITRYDAGEGDISTIITSYGLTEADAQAVTAEVYLKRPDIEVNTEV